MSDEGRYRAARAAKKILVKIFVRFARAGNKKIFAAKGFQLRS